MSDKLLYIFHNIRFVTYITISYVRRHITYLILTAMLHYIFSPHTNAALHI